MEKICQLQDPLEDPGTDHINAKKTTRRKDLQLQADTPPRTFPLRPASPAEEKGRGVAEIYVTGTTSAQIYSREDKLGGGRETEKMFAHAHLGILHKTSYNEKYYTLVSCT
jgi:hypothetical protein